MKIISVDNFDRESHNYPDRFVAHVHSPRIAMQVVALLNQDRDGDGDVFYMAASDEYVLRKFDPNEGA